MIAVYAASVVFQASLFLTSVLLPFFGPKKLFPALRLYTVADVTSSISPSVSNVVLLVFRTLSAGFSLYITSTFIVDFAKLRFMTNLSFLSHTLYFVCVSVASFALWRKRESDLQLATMVGRSMEVWCILNVSCAMLVTVVFWTLLGPRGDNLFLCISTHGVNLVLQVAELLMNRVSVKTSDAVFPFAFLGVYGVFGVSHARVSETPIYHFLVTDNWTALLWLLAMVVGMTAGFLATFYLAKWGKAKSKSLAIPRESRLLPSPVSLNIV